VGYDQEMRGNVQPLPADPPSVEELKPPLPPALPDAPDESERENEKDRIIRSLREEIRMLRQRLDSLENDRS
jgi:hypothetical protein